MTNCQLEISDNDKVLVNYIKAYFYVHEHTLTQLTCTCHVMYTQLTFTLKSTIETPEKRVKYDQS